MSGKLKMGRNSRIAGRMHVFKYSWSTAAHACILDEMRPVRMITLKLVRLGSYICTPYETCIQEWQHTISELRLIFYIIRHSHAFPPDALPTHCKWQPRLVQGLPAILSSGCTCTPVSFVASGVVERAADAYSCPVSQSETLGTLHGLTLAIQLLQRLQVQVQPQNKAK